MRFVIIAMLLVATPSGAGQPYSQSLAQCAALMDLSNRRAPDRRSGGKGMRMTAARDAYYAAAVAQAAREGHGDGLKRVAALYADAAADWDGRGMLFVFSEEAQDWFRYCGKLAAHLGFQP
ncbi:hypothetical protein [Psychromarinibacter halotolerans]|uniref:Uncharacterized protein n=1 Tax=Psychromarinibacter halotolerans TaxID=1775175 RepID=A0ABV7GNY5_9RHOB|nr:hypothetical protein [Psychromarinibacter halotolerans]MDF0597074.1 hypothetical protein [Psychromarinibacter halotolerans]